MKPEDKEYIFRNIDKKSIREIAKDLNIKERKIHIFLEKSKKHIKKTVSVSGRSIEKSSVRAIPDFIIAIGIFAVALIIRILFIRQITASPLTYFSLDDLYYDSWALEISKGAILGNEVFYGLPLYPYLLGLVYFIFGHSLFIARMLQAVLGALSCVLLFFIGKKVFDKITAIVASLILAFYGMSLYFEGFLNSTPLSLVINLSVLLILFSVYKNPGLKKWVALGLLLGVASLGNASIVLFMLFIILWAVIAFKSSGKKEISLRILYMTTAFLAVISVATLRNYVVGKDFVPITAHAGITFYAGNNPRSTGSYYLPYNLGKGVSRTKIASKVIAEKKLGKKMKPSEISRFWFGEAFTFIKHNPFLYANLLFKKLYLFWWIRDIPEVVPLKFVKDYAPVLRLALFNFALISPLSILGLILSYRGKKKNISILYIFLGSVLLSTTIYFVNSRYRMAAEPILILFASFTILLCYRKIRKKKYSHFLSIIACAVLLFPILNVNMGTFSKDTTYNHLGVLYKSKGQFTKAKKAFSQAIEINPSNPTSHFNLGIIYLKQKKYNKAFEEFKEALRIEPYFAEAYLNMGSIYAIKGQLDKAEELFKKGIEINPLIMSLHYNLGTLYLDRQRYKEALEELKEALRLNPDYADAHNNLAVTYKHLGKRDKAIYHFEYSLKINPHQKNIKRFLDDLKK